MVRRQKGGREGKGVAFCILSGCGGEADKDREERSCRSGEGEKE